MNSTGAAILGGLGYGLEQEALRRKNIEEEQREVRKQEALAIREQNLARFKHDLDLERIDAQHEYDISELQAVDDLNKGKEVRDRKNFISDRLYTEEQSGKNKDLKGYDESGVPVFANAHGELFRNGEPYSGPLHGQKNDTQSDFDRKYKILKENNPTPEEVKSFLGVKQPESPFAGNPQYDSLSGKVVYPMKDGTVAESYTPSQAERLADEDAKKWASTQNKKPSEEAIERYKKERASVYRNGARILSDMPVQGAPSKQKAPANMASTFEEVLNASPEYKKRYMDATPEEQQKIRQAVNDRLSSMRQ